MNLSNRSQPRRAPTLVRGMQIGALRPKQRSVTLNPIAVRVRSVVSAVSGKRNDQHHQCHDEYLHQRDKSHEASRRVEEESFTARLSRPNGCASRARGEFFSHGTSSRTGAPSQRRSGDEGRSRSLDIARARGRSIASARVILAIDQGTTGSTCIVFGEDGREQGRGYSEFEQHFPQPGWVEHDAAEIWETTRKVAIAALADAGVQGSDLKGIGITNQRETVVAWDPKTGEPMHHALVWQDRRTAKRCDELREADGVQDMVRERTGLVIDPYFSGTKIEWLIRNAEVEGRGVRDDRLLARLQADRPPRQRLLERLADAAVRHPQARLGRRALRAARRRPRPAARARALGPGLRDDLGVRRRGPGRRDRRRPAGGAVRPGLPLARRGQEHLRDRELRPAERRAPRRRSRRRAC